MTDTTLKAVCYVTLSVSNLDKSIAFYQDVLGFRVAITYEPTRWVAFALDGEAGFAIGQTDGTFAPPTSAMLDFFVHDVEAFWESIRAKVDVVRPLEWTDWGSHKFIINDPDNNKLGFVQRDA